MPYRAIAILLVSFGSIASHPQAMFAQDAQAQIPRETLEALLYETKIEISFGGEVGAQVVSSLRFDTRDGKELLLLEERETSQTTALGEDSSSETTIRTWYELVGKGVIYAGEEFEIEDGSKRVSRLRRSGNEFVRSLEVLGESVDEVVDASLDSLQERMRFVKWLSGPREEGDTFSMKQYSWIDLEFGLSESHVYKTPVEIQIGGKTLRGHRMRSSLEGVPGEATFLPTGMLWHGSLAGGLVEIRTVEAWTKPTAGPRTDFATISRLPVDVGLGETRRLEELVLNLPPIATGIFASGPRQEVQPCGDGERLVVRADHVRAGEDALSADQRKAELASTPEYALDIPRVGAKAREIVGESTDASEIASQLCRWIFENLEYTAAQNAVSCLEVLDSGSGDCTEHTLLFVALARSLGVPAREVGGLVWAEDEEYGDGFYGHAWAEIHNGKRWVSVDPTWGTVGVTAGHVTIGEMEQIRLMNLVGRGFTFELERLSRSAAIEE